MSSPRKIEANRRNALRSTGPRSASGKRKSAENSFQHGLAVSIRGDSVAYTRIDDLARALCRDAAGEQLEVVRLLAEAELDVLRIENARINLLRRREAGSFAKKPEGPDDEAGRAKELRGDVPDSLVSAQQALPQKMKKLDRYARRARSRRRRAAIIQSKVSEQTS